MASRSLVVKVTAGSDDHERCNQALTVAATAVASGVPVSLWLTGEAAWFALPRPRRRRHAPARGAARRAAGQVLDEGTVTVCTQCAARRDITADDMIKGVRIAGASTFVAEVMADGAQALVY